MNEEDTFNTLRRTPLLQMPLGITKHELKLYGWTEVEFLSATHDRYKVSAFLAGREDYIEYWKNKEWSN